MSAPIFRDDSSPADKRTAALGKLMEMCPQPYRITMRGLIETALAGASDDMVEGLLSDIDAVRESAAVGNFDNIATIARRYGATDETLQTYLPMFMPR